MRLQRGRRPLERVRVRSRPLVDELHPLGEGGDLGLQGPDPLTAGLSNVAMEKDMIKGTKWATFGRLIIPSHSLPPFALFCTLH